MEKITINGVEYKLTPVENESPNSVESKFKVGDWILIDIPCKVKGVDEHGNYIVEYINSDNKEMHILSKNFCESHFHLWTLANAKEGNIICIKNAPFIYKSHDSRYIYTHCTLNFEGEFLSLTPLCWDIVKYYDEIFPATKEQRDFLFSKMNEAGYEWDADKKELKKCTPIFTVGDTIIKKPVSDINFGYFTITDINGGKYWYNDRIICEISEQNDWELVKQKPAERESETQPKQCWSEEDEKMYRRLHNLIYSTPYCDSRKELSDWLEFLKDRVQPQNHWKPSEVKDADLIIHTIITECCDWLAICTDLSHDLIEDCRNLMLAVKDEEFKAQKGE